MKKITEAGIIEDAGNTVLNKTGGWRTFKPVRDRKRCIKCGQCWMYCPDNSITESFDADLDYCKGCGICAQACPVKCIEMVKEEK